MYMRQPYQLKLQLKLKFHEISPADFGVHEIIQAYKHTLRVPLDLTPEVRQHQIRTEYSSRDLNRR